MARRLKEASVQEYLHRVALGIINCPGRHCLDRGIAEQIGKYLVRVVTLDSYYTRIGHLRWEVAADFLYLPLLRQRLIYVCAFKRHKVSNRPPRHYYSYSHQTQRPSRSDQKREQIALRHS